MKVARRSLIAVFAVPVVLAIASLTGLVGALLADGAWDRAGAGLLGVCVMVVVWARFGRRRG